MWRTHTEMYFRSPDIYENQLNYTTLSFFFFFLLPALCLFPLFAYGSYKRQTYRLGGRAVAALLNILALFFFYSYVRNCGQDIIALLAYTSLVILHQALAVCEHMVQTILEVMSYFMLARLFFFF